RMVWDNSNIIESYSGVTTPMTFSFIRRAYTIVYHCFSEVMGIAPAKVRASRGVFENMLGLIRGRVYYNLPNWYRLIRLFPGFQYNAKFMESMMGLKEPLMLDDPDPPLSFWRKWFVELPALVRLLVRTSWNFWRIRPIVDQFQSHFKQHYDVWDNLEFRSLAPRKLKKLYTEMEDALLWNWKAPIINDFYVMVNYGLLKHLCRKWTGDATGALQNDLICGEGGVESAEPAKLLLKLAAVAIDQPELKHTIEATPLEDVAGRVQQDPRFVKFNEMMATYLKLYGFRCMNELKLEEFSLRDRPQMVYQVLRNYLRLEDRSALDVEAMHQREQTTRKNAEQKAFGGIGSFWRRWIFRRVLRNARLGVKNRENMRFARTRIYGLLREILRALGGQLADERILQDSEDIFYLTIDEVWDFLQGTAVSTNLAELALLRRQEYDRFRADEAPDDRFETFGYVYHKNSFRRTATNTVVATDGQLRGIGCCPGKVTNRVRVLSSPNDDLALQGEILVAERTDPGWVPLYPAVSGILIERGSVLSHSAVVAREMGIPTIVGITGLLKAIKDGDTVTMDGEAGTVTLGDGA
ncbi:MAG: PEP-utilizing enzyme, partial [Pirellulaceae bacterium]|nr:PEP-utilizing enzyme [Pirellulaceae bacterium]